MCWDVGSSIADSLNVISAAGNIIGTGVKAFGESKDAVARREAAEFNASTYRQNQAFAEEEARDALDRGRLSERRARLATRQLIGKQRARTAANNIRVDEGSAVDIQADSAYLGELDALIIRENAAREARSIRQQATNFGAQAQLTQAAADDISPFLSAAPTILTGASTVADNWLRYRHGS